MTMNGLYYYTKDEVDALLEGITPGGSFTPELKAKLDGIESGAEVNDIDTIKVNGTAQAISNKAVNITVPTNNNQLTNGAGYQTAANVQSAISGKADSATTLAGYGITNAYTKSQVDTALSAKQGTLTAGAGITITNNIVAQTIPTYYGTCGTWAADRAKNVDCAGFVLQDGARVLVNFEHQAGDSLSMNIRTLNVNNTGAKTIVGPGLMEGFKGEPLWEDHQLVEFRYDATNEKWVIIGHGFASTSDYGITKLYDGIASTSTKMAATANAVKTAYDMAAKRIGVTLYDNSTGAYSGITLSDSVDNYSYIEIYFKTNDGYQGYKKCIGGATFDTDLYGMQCNSGGAMYYKASIFTFNGTSVELKAANRSVEAGIIKNQYPTITAANYLLITRVVGIKS